MTPGARISAAIEILDAVFDGAAAEQALTRWARKSRYAGSKDRAAVRDHVFQALRCRRSYAALGGGNDGRGIMIGAMRTAGEDLGALFTGEGHAPRALSAKEQKASRTDLSEAEAADLPDWLWSVFIEDLGADALPMATLQMARAPIALRVNVNINTVPEAIETLAEEGVSVSAVDGSSTALIVQDGERKIRNTPAYQTGAVELQDVSSQAAMARVSIPPRARVLDYCAGGGGKTLALAALVAPNTEVSFFAHDSDPSRMSDLPARAERAGVDVTRVRSAQLSSVGRFDVVLCDVPCSGSGTWRRSPEAKWRLTPERLGQLIEIQQDILEQAHQLVRPGGQLIYTTCSVLRRENAAQVARFCQAHPEFVLRDEMSWPVSETGDGFFFAALTRST